MAVSAQRGQGGGQDPAWPGQLSVAGAGSRTQRDLQGPAWLGKGPGPRAVVVVPGLQRGPGDDQGPAGTGGATWTSTQCGRGPSGAGAMAGTRAHCGRQAACKGTQWDRGGWPNAPQGRGAMQWQLQVGQCTPMEVGGR